MLDLKVAKPDSVDDKKIVSALKIPKESNKIIKVVQKYIEQKINKDRLDTNLTLPVSQMSHDNDGSLL